MLQSLPKALNKIQIPFASLIQITRKRLRFAVLLPHSPTTLFLSVSKMRDSFFHLLPSGTITMYWTNESKTNMDKNYSLSLMKTNNITWFQKRLETNACVQANAIYISEFSSTIWPHNTIFWVTFTSQSILSVTYRYTLTCLQHDITGMSVSQFMCILGSHQVEII